MSVNNDDVPMGDVDTRNDHHLPLSTDEQRALDLYDTLQKLRVEIALLNAQLANASESQSSDDVPEQTRQDLLDARAMFKLRQDAVDTVMIANPVLKAVHNGTDATPVERHVYAPFRDDAAIAVSKHASAVETTLGESTRVQADTALTVARNVELVAELLDLAAQVEERKRGHLNDARSQGEVRRLEEQVRLSKRRWQVVKGLSSGIVAGSGVDWARDDELRDMVLDPDDDDDP
ncbi:centromere protein Cenp-H [Purpureocillium lilacinum]|uniref:Centromere protein Cenp-H n=1 Tax=Purpureocillium lilacinum TaxID=33203 RepID=A0A179H2I4_PURLI|nr:centromere protein Cenp-H [Purpureocillium lilacinum]